MSPIFTLARSFPFREEFEEAAQKLGGVVVTHQEYDSATQEERDEFTLEIAEDYFERFLDQPFFSPKIVNESEDALLLEIRGLTSETEEWEPIDLWVPKTQINESGDVSKAFRRKTELKNLVFQEHYHAAHFTKYAFGLGAYTPGK